MFLTVKEIEALIRYHRDCLAQYRQHISPAAQYLEEQTIKGLEELKQAKEGLQYKDTVEVK